MKAMMVDADKALCWTDVPAPTIQADEVLVQVHAAAVNRADLLQREGNYPPPPGSPAWLGLEVAGTICAVGSSVAEHGRWKVGDLACALLGGGGYAEFAAVPEGMLMPIPRGVSLLEAAAMPEAFGAAYLFLFVEAGMKAGNTILVQAGASGLASVLIPMAQAFGARVITTVRTPEIAQSIRHLKAARVVDTSRERLPEVLQQELEMGHGVDIAIDCLGGPDVGASLPFMNRGGRWIIIATLEDDHTQVDLKAMYLRGARLIGTTLRSRTPNEKAQMISEMVARVWPKVETSEIRPTIYQVLPMAQADMAHTLMREGKSIGKLVLTLDE